MSLTSVVRSLSQSIDRIDDVVRNGQLLSQLPTGITGQGLAGFTDLTLLRNVVFALVLASVLGALIAYHPRSRRTVDRIVEADAQKALVMYAAIGATTGIMVMKYGMVVGFVIFGIGGLIRFRTELRSTMMTGRLIFVTLVGLACGLDLPHLAVLATAFAFALIAVQDASVTYEVTVKGLTTATIEAAARAYAELLAREHCRILGERKRFSKGSVSLVFRAPHRVTRDRLDQVLTTAIPAELRGALDWEAD
jgi:hypothetical protein